jgi:hypothetical protein
MKEVKQFLQKANIKINNSRVRELFQVFMHVVNLMLYMMIYTVSHIH